MIRDFAERCPTQAGTLEELHASLTEMQSVVSMPVAEGTMAARQYSRRPPCPPKEEKLDRWLVKPTDGIYAIESPDFHSISRQLIKFPITRIW